jgi:hypothetical protein
MIVTRESIIGYWAEEPAREAIPKGFVRVGNVIGFPDLDTLSSKEKDILRPVIAAHPEYLEHEIICEVVTQ